jgi:hypothetical protein
MDKGCRMEANTPLKVLCIALRRSSSEQPELKWINLLKLTAQNTQFQKYLLSPTNTRSNYGLMWEIPTVHAGSKAILPYLSNVACRY